MEHSVLDDEDDLGALLSGTLCRSQRMATLGLARGRPRQASNRMQMTTGPTAPVPRLPLNRVLPSTTMGIGLSARVTEGKKIDSFLPCQSSFRCPACRGWFILDERLRDNSSDRTEVLSGVSQHRHTTNENLALRGAVHPQRLLFLAARQRFYCDHVPSCHRMQTHAEQRIKTEAAKAAKAEAKRLMESRLLPSSHSFVTPGRGRDSDELLLADAKSVRLDIDPNALLSSEQKTAYDKWIAVEVPSRLSSARSDGGLDLGAKLSFYFFRTDSGSQSASKESAARTQRAMDWHGMHLDRLHIITPSTASNRLRTVR